MPRDLRNEREANQDMFRALKALPKLKHVKLPRNRAPLFTWGGFFDALIFGVVVSMLLVAGSGVFK